MIEIMNFHYGNIRVENGGRQWRNTVMSIPNRPQHSGLAVFGRFLTRLAIAAGDRLADSYLRASQRRRLRELSDLGLADIGVSRADAWEEYRKPFWKK